MGFLGVVPDEPGGELPVESVEVVGEMLVGLDKAMPQGAVEALVAPVLLRWVGQMRPRWGGKKGWLSLSARRLKMPLFSVEFPLYVEKFRKIA